MIGTLLRALGVVGACLVFGWIAFTAQAQWGGPGMLIARGVAVNGVCGPKSGVPASVIPTDPGLCTVGVSTPVTGTGPWNWSCVGFNRGTTASCSAPISGGSVPGPAQAAGFTTNFIHRHFQQTQSDTFFLCGNGLGSYPSSGSNMYYQYSWQPGFNVACGSNVGQSNDPQTGLLSFHIHWPASACDSGCTGGPNQVLYGFQGQSNDHVSENLIPQGHYGEVRFRMGHSAPYGTNNGWPDAGFWEWSGDVGGGSSGNALERDWLEVYSDGGGDVATHQWGSADTGCCGGTPQFHDYAFTQDWGQYHTVGMLTTNDGNSTMWTCFFLDGNQTSCGSDQTTPNTVQNFKQFLVLWMGNFSVDQDIYIDYIDVWTCSNTGSNCPGTVVTHYP